MADSGYKNISRIDNPRKRMYGWYVRVQFKGQSHAKFFNDVIYDGSEGALQEAIEYRNNLEIEMGKPRTERYIIGRRHRSNNTGVPGVMRTQRVEKKRGREYTREVYEVTWNPEPNRVCRTTVSVTKYGEEKAFEIACSIRAAKMAEVYQKSRNPVPPQPESLP